jgi:hypothetical protein
MNESEIIMAKTNPRKRLFLVSFILQVTTPAVYQCSCMSMLQVKDIKFVIYGVSFEQSGVNILITQYETLEKKEICI